MEEKKRGMWIWEIWNPYTNRLPDLGEGSEVIWTNTLVTTQTLLLTSRSKGDLRMSVLREQETGFTALCYSLHIQRTRSTGGFCGYANTDQGISWLYSLKFAPASTFFLPVDLSIMTVAKGRSALMSTQLITGKVLWSHPSTDKTTAVYFLSLIQTLSFMGSNNMNVNTSLKWWTFHCTKVVRFLCTSMGVTTCTDKNLQRTVRMTGHSLL